LSLRELEVQLLLLLSVLQLPLLEGLLGLSELFGQLAHPFRRFRVPAGPLLLPLLKVVDVCLK